MYAVYFRKYRRTDSLLLYPRLYHICRQLRACSTQASAMRYPLSRESPILCEITLVNLVWNHMISYLPVCTLRTHALLPLLDIPTFEPSPNSHTHRGEEARYPRGRNVGAPCGGCTLVFSGCVSLRTEGGRIRLPGEARMEHTLRESV